MNAEEKFFHRRRQLQIVLLILFIAFAVMLFLRRPLQERATIESMPAVERQTTYEKELAAFQALCIDGPGTQLDARCRERADFLQRFPECDTSCRSQTDRFVAHGSR